MLQPSCRGPGISSCKPRLAWALALALALNGNAQCTDCRQLLTAAQLGTDSELHASNCTPQTAVASLTLHWQASNCTVEACASTSTTQTCLHLVAEVEVGDGRRCRHVAHHGLQVAISKFWAWAQLSNSIRERGGMGADAASSGTSWPSAVWQRRASQSRAKCHRRQSRRSPTFEAVKPSSDNMLPRLRGQ